MFSTLTHRSSKYWVGLVEVEIVTLPDAMGYAAEAEVAAPTIRGGSDINSVPARTASPEEILVVQPWIRLGGAELVSIHLAHELERLGRSTGIACVFLDLKGLPEWAGGLQYHLPPRWLAERMRKSRLLFLLFGPWILLGLLWKHSKGAQILNPHNFPATWVASVVGAFRRIPVVWFCNEPPTRVPLRDAFKVGLPDYLGWFVASSWLDRLFVKGIAGVGVPSAMTQAQTQSRYRRLVEIIHVGVDADFFCSNDGSDPRRTFGLVGKYVLLCIGKLHPQKNQVVCLQALKELVEHIPNAMLVLAGDGPSADELKSLTRRWGLQEHVLFTGHVDAITARQLFQACDVNLVPAINQSWGFTAFEALCTGKVSVVSQSAGGAAEILSENRIGLACEPTGHAFAQAILHLYRDGETYSRFSMVGREHVLRHLTWQAFARRNVDMFDAQLGIRT
jgi:glycosyltransferase involved in cell wall biosynthesis